MELEHDTEAFVYIYTWFASEKNESRFFNLCYMLENLLYVTHKHIHPLF